MVRPAGEIADAIAAKDTKALVALPEIGKRTAETVVAELHGKVDEYVTGRAPGAAEEPELSVGAQEAIAVLVQLGERRSDAVARIERVLSVSPDLEAPEEIIAASYKLRAGGT